MKTNCKPFVLLLLTTLLLHYTGKTQCDVSDVKHPASVINNNSTGNFDWDAATDVYSSNNAHASAGFLLGVLATVHSNYMMLEDFDMSIPAAVTICGIEVRIERKASGLGLLGASVRDHTVSLLKNGSIIGTNKASTSNWTGSDQTITYGSSSDLWGTTWTSADINAANFGLAFSAELKSGLAGLFLSADVDNVRITVYYQHIVLPMAIHNFKAAKKGNTSLLSWEVKDEVSNLTFYIERSADQQKWITIDSVSSAKNNNAIHSFNFIDKIPIDHVNFYRLKQFDTDGKLYYSAIERVAHLPHQNDLSLSIQPSSKTLVLSSTVPIERCTIYHPSGYTAGTFTNQRVSNKMLISTEILSGGHYILQVYVKNKRYSRQILLRK